MSCRVQAVRDVRALGHWPTFAASDLPDGYAECLVCRDWITAVDLFAGVCPGAAAEPDARGNAWRSVDHLDAESARTVSMVARCAEHQR